MGDSQAITKSFLRRFRDTMLAGQFKDEADITGGTISNVLIDGATITNAIIPQIPAQYFASIETYGAIAGGSVDCLTAIQAALSANNAVYIPEGTFRISGTVEVAFGKRLFGAGVSSVLQPDNNTYDAIKIPSGYAELAQFKISRGDAGIRLFGRDGSCIDNSIEDIVIEDTHYGLILDGYTDTNKPCYWNKFERVTIRRPLVHGVWLTKSGAGDTPNANIFDNIRVHSLATNISGSGIYVEYGKFSNIFTNPTVDLTTTAVSCIRMGANSDRTRLINPYTETDGAVNNITLDLGSVETSIINLQAASGGAAISDSSGGNYTTFNAGSPVQNYIPNLNIGFPTRVTADTLIPQIGLHGLTADTATFGVYRYVNSAAGSNIQLNKTRSTTLGNQGAVQSGDILGTLSFNGSDNSQIRQSSKIVGQVDGSISSNFIPGRLVFQVSTAAGVISEAMRIDSKKNIVVGTGSLATTATDGFLYFPTTPGTPTGIPTAYTGGSPVLIDTTGNKFWYYNAGWQSMGGAATITLSGDVTGSGTTSITTAIASGVIVNGDINASAAIALSKLATQAANTFVANATSSTAVPTASVTLAASQLAGRGSTGDLAPITLGTNLSISGTVLNAASTPSAYSTLFTSAEITVGANGSNTPTAHGLGAVPTAVYVVLRNKTAELGYSIGDEIRFTGDRGDNYGWQFYANATNVNIIIGSSGVQIWNTSGGITAITTGNWRFVIYAAR